MKEYIKIETPFKRAEDGSKKLMTDCWRNPTVEFLKDNEWLFTEKIDGTNISVVWDGHRVSFHGRTERAQIPSSLMNYLMDIFSGNEVEELFEQVFGDKEVILYGEGYGAKIQNGGNYRSDVSFILFDVLIDNMWLTRESVESIAKTFGIDVVPVVLRGTIKDAIDFVMTNPKSTIGTAMMEGVVGRPVCEMYDRRGERIITKIKVRDFRI